MTEKRNGTLLLEAFALVNGSRQEAYGDPSENLRNVAESWSGYLGKNLSAADVCLLMAELKLKRQRFKHSRDNLLDACGYLAIADDLTQGTAPEGARSDTKVDTLKKEKVHLSAETLHHVFNRALAMIDCGEIERAISTLKDCGGFSEEGVTGLLREMLSLVREQRESRQAAKGGGCFSEADV